VNMKKLALGLGLLGAIITGLLLSVQPTTPQTEELRRQTALWRSSASGDIAAHRKLHAMADTVNKPYLAFQGAAMGDEAFAREYFAYFSKLSQIEQAETLAVYRRTETSDRAKCYLDALAAMEYNPACFVQPSAQ
jgi:hypothetical protein